MTKQRRQPVKELHPPAAVEGIAHFLSEQKETFLPDTHLEVINSSEAVLEGCRGVLEYGPQRIRLNCERRVICFLGDNLELRCLTASTAVVTGRILSIQFDT